jgi:DNA helicase-2/ATP-dependent DNA helicase PcrA
MTSLYGSGFENTAYEGAGYENRRRPVKKASPPPAFKYNINDYIKKGSEMGGAAPDYAVGDSVSHVKFGKGTVLSMTERDGDYDVSVEFEKFGVRKLRASFSKLKKI